MIGIFDWSIWLVYFTLILLLLLIYKNSKKDVIYRYFIPGFIIKVVGGVAFALIYVYYYGFGDTFLYHKGAIVLADVLVDSPSDYFRLIFSSSGEGIPADLSFITNQIQYSRTYEEWFMIKLISPVSLVSFHSYLVITLLMSSLSFLGAWKLMLVFRDILPNHSLLVFTCAFLVPSVMFWGGGIMKDTITLFALNYLIYIAYFTIIKKNLNIYLLSLSIVLIFIIISLKAYIILSFLPGLALMIYSSLTKSIDSKVLQFFIGPVLMLLLLLGSYFGLSMITDSSTKYSAENLEWQVKGFHSWHTDVGGSTYNLGETDLSPTGVIRKIPAALNVTYFRPYVWEARSPVVAIGAVESLVLFLLFLIVAIRYRFRAIKYIREQPLLSGTLLFCLIFGFAVGFTSYNFGALARYKIPVMSLFTFVLVYLYVYPKEQQNDKIQLSD